MRVRVTLVFDVSVRWGVVLWVLAAFSCLKLKETLMNSYISVVLFGAALLPVPGLAKAPTNTET